MKMMNDSWEKRRRAKGAPVVPSVMTAHALSTVLTSAHDTAHIKSKGLNTVRGFSLLWWNPTPMHFRHTQNTELHSEIEYCIP